MNTDACVESRSHSRKQCTSLGSHCPQTDLWTDTRLKRIETIITRPIYCISDLHLGDGGPRDNFLPAKEKQLLSFLDYVEEQDGELLILGDLFELWQANWSKVFTYRKHLLDRLAVLGATYILGNHDADLYHFQGTSWINHPLFFRDGQ